MDSVIQKEEERDGFSYAIVRFSTFTAIGEEELSSLSVWSSTELEHSLGKREIF